MTHPSRDDLSAYALGALDPGEEGAISDHTAACERCAGELRDRLAPAIGVLAESVDQVEPPPELRERLLRIVREEAEAGQVAAPARPKRRGLRGFLLRPAAGLAVLVIAVAGVAGYLVNDNGEEGASTVPVTSGAGISGSLVVADDSAMLSVHGMPGLAKGAVYQVWVAEGSSVLPDANFAPTPDGRGTVAISGHLAKGSQVLVTPEPRPGLRAPTSQPLLSAKVD